MLKYATASMNTSDPDPESGRTGAAGPDYHEILSEVRYGETDQMGYAHHSNAVLWFEMGRVAWLRHRGLSYRELESSGVLLPVIGMTMRYHAPGRFEDPIAIQTRLIELGKTRVTFENRVLRVETSEQRTLLVAGTVELACVDRSGKIRRVPEEFQRIWDEIRKRAAST
jgi:acyl-CoA thioester hydrolase